MTSAHLSLPTGWLQTSGPRQLQGPQPLQRLEVFLSHSTSDQRHVSLVQQQMEALGISVYLAEHDPQPGTILGVIVKCCG